jgi:hypothetical protein
MIDWNKPNPLLLDYLIASKAAVEKIHTGKQNTYRKK